MPDDIMAKLAAAKATLAQAKSTLPQMAPPPGAGHAVGVGFANQHGADHQGSTVTGLVNQAGSDPQALAARAAAMKTLDPQ